MRTYDLSPLYRTTVGFDQYADLLDRIFSQDFAPSRHPPFNIEKTSEDKYRISIAVAGYSEDELSVELRENQLIVTAARKDEEDGKTYLHRGIAKRAFEKKFQLADHIIVDSAAYENGMLHVDLKREVPDALKPRRIAIASTVGSKSGEANRLAA